MRIIHASCYLAIAITSLNSCGSGSSESSGPQFKSASSSVREITLPDPNCYATNFNDNTEILLECLNAPEDGEVTNRIEILQTDGSSREIYRTSGIYGRVPLSLANDGSALLILWGPYQTDGSGDSNERSLILGRGEPIVLPVPQGQTATAQSPNGEYISVSQPLSMELSYLRNLESAIISKAPDGVLVYEPYSINDSGDAVGYAAIGSEGTGFSTTAGYRVIKGRFELLSFASRPELGSTIGKSINAAGDVLLEVDTGNSATFTVEKLEPVSSPSSTSSPSFATYSVASLAIFTTSGELIEIAVPEKGKPASAIRLNNSGKVLGATYIDSPFDPVYFVSEKDKQPILITSLIELGSNEYISLVSLNNRNELLITTITFFPTADVEASDKTSRPRTLIVKL